MKTLVYAYLQWFNRSGLFSKQELKLPIDLDALSQVIDESQLDETSRQIDQLHSAGGKLALYGDDDYPEAFNFLDNPPYLISYFGNPVWNEKACIGVVGSRKPMLQTKTWLDEHFLEYLLKRDYCVVSGGARGIDQKAHAIALKVARKTVSFLPSGLLRFTHSRLSDLLNPL